jgi:CrcB protein
LSAGTWLGVAALGSVGALLRFLLDGIVATRVGRGFPSGTLAVNVSGTLLLGLLAGLEVQGRALTLAGTAAIGSYTTFSTWMLETHRLRENGELARAGFNVVVSLVVGFGAVALGRAIG